MNDFWQRFDDVVQSGGIGAEARETLIALLKPLMAAPAPPVVPSSGPRIGRYVDLALIGRGGMGVVRRVRDPALNRTMALKVVHPELLRDPDGLARFVEEAQVTAQLEHPGIVPVFELGRLEDGRLYYTMREVAGRNLAEVAAEVYSALPVPSPSGWTVRRLLDAFHQACRAVGFAHKRGVLHRDLKPGNIMLGQFGEVYVVDWGLAKVVGRSDTLRAAAPSASETIRTSRRDDDALATRAGDVLGTPAYMSPEQARAEPVGPTSDVYALGAVLFEILSGKRAFSGTNAWRVLARVVTGMVEPLEGPLPIPPELALVVKQAMRLDPAERYPDAIALADAVGAWLDGESQRERALDEVAAADALLIRRDALREESAALRARAATEAAGLLPWDPVDRKRAAWALQDEADALRREATATEAQATQRLFGALTHRADLDAALSRLADLDRDLLVAAEAARDDDGAARAEALLRGTGRPAHLRWLDGDGVLSLETDPPGAAAALYRVTLQDRRRTPVFVRELGRTPLRDVPVPPGSYVVALQAEGREAVRVPLCIERAARRDGDRSAEAAPIPLPPSGALGEGAVYVPAGPAWLGGDDDARAGLPRQRVWVDGFAIERLPVTSYGWLADLNDLVARGAASEALRRTPVVPGAYDWSPRLPVRGVDHASAEAYAAWRAERTGLPWRLPTEREWEKAARGVDGRLFPWGDHLDPTWCCVLDSQESGGHLAPAGEPPADESPYGVLGLAGGVADWCADPAPPPQAVDRRAVRGGRFNEAGGWASRAASRTWLARDTRDPAVGLRLVCSWPPPQT